MNEIEITITRDALIELCRSAVVPHNKWSDRDTASALRQVGEAFMLLSAGCPFKILTGSNKSGHDCVTDGDTIWIDITFDGFEYFEIGDSQTETFYIPTRKRLDERRGTDWY